MAYYQKWQCRHYTMIEFSFFVIGVLTVETLICILSNELLCALCAVIKKRHLHDMYPLFKRTSKFNWNRIIRLQGIVPEIIHFVSHFLYFGSFENILRAFSFALNNNESQITNSKSIIYIKCFMFCKKWKNNPKYKNYGSRIH